MWLSSFLCWDTGDASVFKPAPLPRADPGLAVAHFPTVAGPILTAPAVMGLCLFVKCFHVQCALCGVRGNQGLQEPHLTNHKSKAQRLDITGKVTGL